MVKEIADIIAENKRRNTIAGAPFNPITGEGSIGRRFVVDIEDFPIHRQWLPETMRKVPFVRRLIRAGSVRTLTENICHKCNVPYTEEERQKVIEQFVRIRIRHDFPFWAAMLAYIKQKGGGEDVLFRLNRPQRRLVETFELMRVDGKPIRIVLLKARQWGGSTVTQIYMAWLQLVHKKGLNSLIIAHQGSGSDEINDMFNRLIERYPVEMLHDLGEAFAENEGKYVGVGKSGNIHRVPQRNAKIKIGTAERPDGCRGGDYNLVHLSEVGVWKTTDGKSPKEIVASACTGVLLAPYTMIVYESTAKGANNLFHDEYRSAKEGRSQFKAVFIPWYDIDWNVLPLKDEENFAEWLYGIRTQEEEPSPREASGRYLWSLWEKGATLENIYWYIEERKGKPSREIMWTECPSDDIEPFVYSGANVFDPYQIQELSKTCHEPRYVGEIIGNATDGDAAMQGIHFVGDANGRLSIWNMPETDEEEKVTNRYLVVVDVGVGRTSKADYSVITVFDRIGMMDMDGVPVIAAQWYGHLDMDLFAWKAAQIASFYDNALLVIESNSYETHNFDVRSTDHSGYILSQISDSYDNLYTREQSPEDIREGKPRKYGFHTNPKTKPIIIDNLQRAVRDRLWVERDMSALDEFLTYVHTIEGRYEASPGCHDDKLMTRAIGLYLCYKMPLPKIVNKNKHKHQSTKSVSEATF